MPLRHQKARCGSWKLKTAGCEAPTNQDAGAEAAVAERCAQQHAEGGSAAVRYALARSDPTSTNGCPARTFACARHCPSFFLEERVKNADRCPLAAQSIPPPGLRLGGASNPSLVKFPKVSPHEAAPT